MIQLEHSQEAAERLQRYVHKTPILASSSLNSLFGKQLTFKAEHLQKTGSFKVRGALNAALQAYDTEGYVTYSTGNHGQAIAYAAKMLGKKAIIVMAIPTAQKVKAIKALGADVYIDSVTATNGEALAVQLAADTGYHLISTFDDERVMAGQGTVALELLEQINQLDAVLMPVGGGSLISGAGMVIKSLRSDILVIGIEPEKANDAQQGYRTGKRVVFSEAPETIADGARTIQVGERAFSYIQHYVDDIIAVPDSLIIEAQTLLMERLKQLVEPTGALGLAAVLAGNPLPPRVGIVLTGGNWLP